MSRMGMIAAWFVLITLAAPAQNVTAIRGVWLTNVDSDALRSRENIVQAVETCAEYGFNTIAVVVWNKGMTLYPSRTLSKLIGTRIDPRYDGRDPLREVIEESHKRNIKVIAWFEYGFAASYKADGGAILAAKPEWRSADANGALATKNGFEWMNGFLPAVQEFILSLISEVVREYDVDGIQGDDRLPAMPVESGYDEYTAGLYRKKNGGARVPRDCKDAKWVSFRADLMTDFMGRIHKTVKGIKKNVLVTMAPSIFPWSREEYLQDWVTWMKKGYVDLIIPQLYRYKTEEYAQLLDDITKRQLSAAEQQRFVPGILLNVGTYTAGEELLSACISANRAAGINGEFYFFYEGIKRHKDFFKNVYPSPAVFPDLLRINKQGTRKR